MALSTGCAIPEAESTLEGTDGLEVTDSASDDGDETGAERPPAVAWLEAGELVVDDFGEAGWISVPFPADQRFVAVRTLPLDVEPDRTARTCHRVLEARLASGAALLPDVGATSGPEHQRFEPGPGGGVFVLSTTEASLREADTLELHIGLFDCALDIPASRARFGGMPHRLRVDRAWEAMPSAEPIEVTLAVRVARAEDSGWDDVTDDPAWARSWEVAAERFADVGVELRLEAHTTVPPTGPVRYTGDMQGFDGLLREVRDGLQPHPADARFVPVALVRCLEFDDEVAGTRDRPLGQATRIPGSMAEARTPSLVVLAAGDCDSTSPMPTLDPERHGVILAHEIGHYLGLLHVDHAGAHLQGADDQRLMDSAVALEVDPADAWFSPAQATVLRRHPDVVLVP